MKVCEDFTITEKARTTVGADKNGTLVFVNFSAQDASILKISVPIIKRRSLRFQYTPNLFANLLVCVIFPHFPISAFRVLNESAPKCSCMRAGSGCAEPGCWWGEIEIRSGPGAAAGVIIATNYNKGARAPTLQHTAFLHRETHVCKLLLIKTFYIPDTGPRLES